MIESEQNSGQSVMINNNDFANYSAIRIRLDTTTVLERIELFLRGCSQVMTQDERGQFAMQRVNIGSPKANDLGIQSIMHFVGSSINASAVQGNFTEEMYWMFITEFNIDLAEAIVINCYDWEITDNDISGIIDFIMKLVMPFISRLIDNKERESYTNTIRTLESTTKKSDTGQKGFGWFGGG